MPGDIITLFLLQRLQPQKVTIDAQLQLHTYTSCIDRQSCVIVIILALTESREQSQLHALQIVMRNRNYSHAYSHYRTYWHLQTGTYNRKQKSVI